LAEQPQLSQVAYCNFLAIAPAAAAPLAPTARPPLCSKELPVAVHSCWHTP
jgi:hypothetical protein